MAEYLEYDWKSQMISRDLHRVTPFKKPPSLDKNIAVQGLRGLIFQSRDLEFKNNAQQDDATLLKFLYAKKFELNESYQLLQNYYWYRKRNSELFKNFNLDSDIRTPLENGLPSVLTSKDRKGRCVLVLPANNWDCSYSLISVYRALLFTLEYLISDVNNQANGFVVIVDWTEFSFRQAMYLKPGVLKLMIEGLQDCFPAKFKGIHFIAQPWYVETALTVIKPFLKDKTKERIYVHGNNLSTLHDHVSKDILPAEMGGEQPSHNPQVWLNKIVLNNNN